MRQRAPSIVHDGRQHAVCTYVMFYSLSQSSIQIGLFTASFAIWPLLQPKAFISRSMDLLLGSFGLPIGVNISERKGGTEWTKKHKKHKKRELEFFTARGFIHRLGATRILPELR